MSAALDLDHFRDRLLEERKRASDALEYLQKDDQGLLDDEHEEIQSDNHLADDATSTYDRELDATLEGNEERTLDAIDAALKRIEAGTYGICSNVRRADRRGAPGGGAVDDAVHRLQAQGRARLNEPRLADLRRPRRLQHGRADAGLGRGALAGGARAPVGWASEPSCSRRSRPTS